MKLNQLKAGVVLSYGQTVLNAIITLAYTPIMLRLLGQNEYGIYTMAASMISYLGLLNFGLGSSYIRYYTRYQQRGDTNGLAQLNGIFFTVYLVISLVALIAGLILSTNVSLFYGETLNDTELRTARILMAVLSCNLMMTFFGTVFTGYITANERFVFQKVVNMGKTVLSPLITIPVLLSGFGSVGMVVVTTAISMTVDIVNIIFCIRKLNMRFAIRGADFGLLKEIAAYSVFIAINSIVDQVNWQIGKIILGHYHGAGETAIFGVASQINTLYINLSTIISSVFIPRIHRLVYASDSQEQFDRLFVKIGRIQMLILGLIGSGFIFYGRPFIEIWAGDGYESAYAMTLLLILPGTIPLIQNIGIEIQRAKNMHRFRSVAYLIMAGVNVLISIPLGNLYGGIGCAVGTAISMVLSNGLLMNWYYDRKIKLNIKYFWLQIAKMFPGIGLSALIGIGLHFLIPTENFWLFLCSGVLYTGVYCVLSWAMIMNRKEKELLISLLRKVVRKK